jgi:branched-chain amino acid transport system permease protein
MKKCVLFFPVLFLAIMFPWLIPNPAITSIAIFTLLYAASATGWNIFSGSTGSISLGHATFFGIGAYTMALVCQDGKISADAVPLLLLPLSGIMACLVALPAGWIVLRVRGNTFVIVTIALFFSFQLLAYNLPAITNGSSGMNLPTPSWNGQVYNTPFYEVALGLVILALLAAWWIRQSRFGLHLRAMRDDEGRAWSLGVRTWANTLIAYVLSAWFVGIAGGIYAYFIGSIDPPFAFDPTFDVAIALICYFGGLGTLWGPIVGAIIVVPMQQYLTIQFGEPGVSQILYGLLFLGTLLVLPHGIIPSVQRWWTRRGSSQSMGQVLSAGEESPLEMPSAKNE